MNIENKIIEDITAKLLTAIDYTTYEIPVQKAIDSYFKSKDFKEYLWEALSDQGIEYEIAQKFAKELTSKLRKKK